MSVPDKREITSIQPRNAQHPIVLDELISDYYPQHPDHTIVLEQCIRLAWRILFSPGGRQAAAQSLAESWMVGKSETPLICGPGEDVFSAAIAEVANFENHQPVTVYIDPNIQRCTETQCDGTVKVRLKLNLSQRASEAHFRALATGSSLSEQRRRDRHVFFIAVLIAHALQQAIVCTATRPVIQAAKEDHHPHSSWIRRTTPAPVGYTGQGQREAEPQKRQGERGGWRFEELLFGGRMIQLAPFTPSEPDWFLGGISGLAAITHEADSTGLRMISDDVIKLVVEGNQGWDNNLPLSKDCLGGYLAGNHPDAVRRMGDGFSSPQRAVRAPIPSSSSRTVFPAYKLVAVKGPFPSLRY